MIKNLKRPLSLIFAAMLIVTAAGCKKSNTSSLSDEIEYIYVDGEDTASGDSQENSNSGSTSGGTQNNSSNKQNSSKVSGTTSGAAKTVNDGVDPAKYKNTKIIYATWKDPKLNEDKSVVENFQNKYGIRV